MNVVHRLLLLLVIIHGRIAGRRCLVDDAVAGRRVLAAGHHVRRVGCAHRVVVVDRVTDDNRPDNDDRLCVHRQDQVDNQGQAPANDEDDVGRKPPITFD